MLTLLLAIILGVVSCEQCKDNNGNIIENCCTSDDEVYKECGTACQPTCATQFPICMAVCKQGCFCKDGMIRKEIDGPCIALEKCPQKTEV
mmetsp:Transcript_35701/g.44093  ORF Transcript_35701/g.44093 Transcript_35701/m.44093 type:complete len:91 (-) Transcript_35701:612-884(-)